MEYPQELKYTSEHEWVSTEEGNRVRVGITDFAQDALGDVVYVDLPEEGTEVSAGEPFGEVESTKSVSDIYSPVTGRIVERNGLLGETPDLVNRDPYGEGWMVVVEATDPSEVDRLMDAGGYRQMVEEAGDQG
ncbi:MAG TPA: glycine cleavage system protein GcvH [Actinomycetota bacterium]|jgi:glycine cleavage system H protein|nr:glycine cleavage system protein GcvH [Actinomycetota bacterium]